MITLKEISEIRTEIAKQKANGKRIGFVPTMGALHEGHLSLVKKAREHADYIVISIFVNPMQFGPNEDFNQYPRDFAHDEQMAAKAGVDLIFYPEVSAMYPADPKVFVDVKGLDQHLCGASRPGHFRGVVTIVAKLFLIVLPDIAVFGEKDFQQYTILKRMVTDLNFPITIIPGPTHRESDGLAMSSRNRYLSPEERACAPLLFQSLKQALHSFQQGITKWEALQTKIADNLIESKIPFRLDYISLVDGQELSPKEDAQEGDVIAIAVYLGKTRLIDNIRLETNK